MTNDLDYAQECFRNAVLEAMDKAAREIFGDAVNRNDCGATDADLPEIFPAVDAQLMRLCIRFDHPLYDSFVGSEAWHRDRAALTKLGFEPTEDDAA